MLDRLDQAVGYFIPRALARDSRTLSRARSFVYVHLFGIPFGLAAVGLICLFEERLSPHNGFFLASVLVFLSYPFLLRRFAILDWLGLLSVVHFTGTLCFNIYHYGGLSSPVLPWAVSVPVVAVFFLNPRYSLASLAVVATGLLSFVVMDAAGVRFPQNLPAEELPTLTWLSILLLLVYVSAMVFAHHRIYMRIQARLGSEIQQHRETERALVEAKDAAEAANQSKSRFLAQMSHELRTPLNAIIGFSEMIRSGVLGSDPARYREYAADINGSGQHLLQLVNEILDLARIEAGRLELSEGWISVPDVVREVNSFARAIARPKRIEVDLFDAGQPVWLYADQLRIKQVLINLISNAIKFTDAGGRVSVHVERARDGGVTFAINDTGVGISEKDKRRVIQPFERGGSIARKGVEGSGLGLPIAIHLTELHGGRLTLNDRPGGGTSVEVWLPAERVRSVPANAAASFGSRGAA
jgi:signal transduction histidine kinase